MDPLIRVLGPVEVGRDRPCVVPGRGPRAVLIALVLGIDHAVDVDHLLFAVWGDDLPASARATLHGYVSTLRHLLGADRIEFADGAYTLRVSVDDVDSVRFERLVVDGSLKLAEDPVGARRTVMEALHLWRGRPFGDLADEEFVVIETRRLEEARLAAMELRLEADIALGMHGSAARLLEGLTFQHPYRERLWYLYLVALARDGRRVEALRAYRELHGICEEIGLEPCCELVELEQQILDDAPAQRAHLVPDGLFGP